MKNSFGEREPDPIGEHKWVIVKQHVSGVIHWHYYKCNCCGVSMAYNSDFSCKWVLNKNSAKVYGDKTFPMTCQQVIMDEALS